MAETPQIEKWRGAFGDAYVDRNRATEERLHASTMLWARLLSRLAGDPPTSVLEVGANIGANLEAIRRVSGARLIALEPNALARTALAGTGIVPEHDIHDGTAQRIPLPDDAVDLAFTCGVLIHVAPDDLSAACREIYRVARKYIVCIEYFSDAPEEIKYRGEAGLLFKRDFGGFWLDQHPDLIPVDWGFNWRRTTGLDNSTYWIFAKRGSST